MSRTAIMEPDVVLTETPEIHHLWCCDRSESMCGFDISHLPVTDVTGEQPCVVCYEMAGDDLDCRKCEGGIGV